MKDLNDLIMKFDLKGQVDSIAPLGNGLINDTYKVTTTDGPSYVLQRINHHIFKDVDLLQKNIVSVTSHIRGKLEAAGTSDVDRKVLDDLRAFAITFDLKITENGTANSETSIISFLSNYQNGSQIPGKTVGWGWLLKYNADEMALETAKAADALQLPETWNTRVNISLNTTYKITIIFDPVRGNAYVIVDDTPIGMVFGSSIPDFSNPSLDNALTIRLNDSGNCAPVIDNLRIFELS